MSRQRDIEVDCTLEIEQTAESLHAHAIPEGVEIRPGDRVLLLAPPPRVGFGERVSLAARARVRRAGPLLRGWTRLCGLFELTELYEVGFAPKE